MILMKIILLLLSFQVLHCYESVYALIIIGRKYFQITYSNAYPKLHDVCIHLNVYCFPGRRSFQIGRLVARINQFYFIMFLQIFARVNHSQPFAKVLMISLICHSQSFSLQFHLIWAFQETLKMTTSVY